MSFNLLTELTQERKDPKDPKLEETQLA